MATDNLRSINQHGASPARPWRTSFCYGRALQDGCRAEWHGRKENVRKAQEVFMLRFKLNGKALLLNLCKVLVCFIKIIVLFSFPIGFVSDNLSHRGADMR